MLCYAMLNGRSLLWYLEFMPYGVCFNDHTVNILEYFDNSRVFPVILFSYIAYPEYTTARHSDISRIRLNK